VKQLPKPLNAILKQSPKVIITARVDRSVYEELKRLNVNVSATIAEYLKQLTKKQSP